MSGLFESVTGLTFADPWLLALALLVPVALGLRLRHGRASVVFAPGEFVRTGDGVELPRTWRVRLAWLPRALQVLALVAAVVALARPVRRDPLPRATEGIDILICLDTSSSMTATDMDARRTRLDVAKDAAARFVAGRRDDRIGLLGFARYPDVRCPLTLDHHALAKILSGVAPVANDGPEDATGIGTAVARAAQVLRGGAAKSKVVILFTDGEENVATAQKPEEIAPLHAAQLCKEMGVRVYAVSAGLGARNRAGEWMDLDTRQVRRLAERTGGRFFEARDAGAVAAVYAEIDALEKAALPEPRWRVEDRFLAFLVAAVALWLTGRVLERTALEVLP
jgi:Ca-activated chloride channel family protein